MKNLLSRVFVLLVGALAVFALFSVSSNQVKKMMPKAVDKPRVVKQQKTVDGLNIQLDSDASEPAAEHATSEADLLTHLPDFHGTRRDLGPDEQAGGHTLGKHVGRTDDELRERLDRENISASSTYSNRSAAEFAVGNALEEGKYRIEKWMQRSGGHPNLVLDYRGDQPIGRTLHRGDSSSQPCSDAKVVLRWLSSSEYYVLTSYPECR